MKDTFYDDIDEDVVVIVDEDDLLVASHQEVEHDLPRRAQHEWFQIAGEAQRIRLL